MTEIPDNEKFLITHLKMYITSTSTLAIPKTSQIINCKSRFITRKSETILLTQALFLTCKGLLSGSSLNYCCMDQSVGLYQVHKKTAPIVTSAVLGTDNKAFALLFVSPALCIFCSEIRSC